MRTDLCDLFGIDVPIFAFSHCRDVVPAVTNAGGLGVLGALAYSPEQLELELKWIEGVLEEYEVPPLPADGGSHDSGSEAQTRIGLAARKDGAKARELVGMPVGEVVGRLTQEMSSKDVIYPFIDEFAETVDRLRQSLDAANEQSR